MDALTIIGEILTLFTLFTRVPSLGESKRMLMNKFECLRARIHDIEDIERAKLSARVQRGKKRNRDTNLYSWVVDSRKLLDVGENLLRKVEECDNIIMCTKMARVVVEYVNTLALHDKKGHMLYLHAFSDEGGPLGGSHIPVKDIVGQATLSTLALLEHLLLDNEVGRIAIHGRDGIGKTFLMKHLHNRVLKWVERFFYVFWVSFTVEFNIKHVQDAVAAVVQCDFSSDNDVNVRAGELSKKLGDLGKFVLFLDGVAKLDVSLDQIGIPVPSEGSMCKLVISTSSTALGCRMLDDFKTAELEPLLEDEAYQLFLHEAKIDMQYVTLLNSIPWLLARKCHGVPRMIVDTASQMCGIGDLHEWKSELFELGNLEKRSKRNMSG